MARIKTVADLTKIREATAERVVARSVGANTKRMQLLICGETGCVSSGCLNVKQAFEEEIAKQALDSPFNRLASPEEFANVAVFLVSPAASYMTGTMLAVDGGMYKATY